MLPGLYYFSPLLQKCVCLRIEARDKETDGGAKQGLLRSGKNAFAINDEKVNATSLKDDRQFTIF